MTNNSFVPRLDYATFDFNTYNKENQNLVASNGRVQNLTKFIKAWETNPNLERTKCLIDGLAKVVAAIAIVVFYKYIFLGEFSKNINNLFYGTKYPNFYPGNTVGLAVGLHVFLIISFSLYSGVFIYFGIKKLSVGCRSQESNLNILKQKRSLEEGKGKAIQDRINQLRDNATTIRGKLLADRSALQRTLRKGDDIATQASNNGIQQVISNIDSRIWSLQTIV